MTARRRHHYQCHCCASQQRHGHRRRRVGAHDVTGRIEPILHACDGCPFCLCRPQFDDLLQVGDNGCEILAQLCKVGANRTIGIIISAFLIFGVMLMFALSAVLIGEFDDVLLHGIGHVVCSCWRARRDAAPGRIASANAAPTLPVPPGRSAHGYRRRWNQPGADALSAR